MAVTDHPAVKLKSLSPELFRALAPSSAGGALKVPVVEKKVPFP
jgi:hypothetical protein